MHLLLDYVAVSASWQQTTASLPQPPPIPQQQQQQQQQHGYQQKQQSHANLDEEALGPDSLQWWLLQLAVAREQTEPVVEATDNIHTRFGTSSSCSSTGTRDGSGGAGGGGLSRGVGCGHSKRCVLIVVALFVCW